MFGNLLFCLMQIIQKNIMLVKQSSVLLTVSNAASFFGEKRCLLDAVAVELRG